MQEELTKELSEQDLDKLRIEIEQKLGELEKKLSNLKNLSNEERLNYLLFACKIIKDDNIQDDKLNLSIIHNLATYASRTNS